MLDLHKRVEQAKLAALQRAVQQGWEDVAEGRHVDVADQELEDFGAQLGRHAAQALNPAD